MKRKMTPDELKKAVWEAEVKVLAERARDKVSDVLQKFYDEGVMKLDKPGEHPLDLLTTVMAATSMGGLSALQCAYCSALAGAKGHEDIKNLEKAMLMFVKQAKAQLDATPEILEKIMGEK